MTIIRMLGEHGTRGVTFGREGLLSPYALDYIQAAKDVCISPKFSTQDGQRLAGLSSSLRDVDMQLSLSGIGSDHDFITQVPGSFDDIERALPLLDSSVGVEARVIIRLDMSHSIGDCVRWCESQGISRVFLSNISSGGSGVDGILRSVLGRAARCDRL